MDIFKTQKTFMLFGLNANQRSVKGAYLFIGAYLFATLFAAILTPPVYWLFEYLHSVYPDNATIAHWIKTKGVNVFFDRLRWLPIIIALPFLFKACGLYSAREAGLLISKKTLRIFLKYFVFGILLAGLIFTLQVVFTDVEIKDISTSKAIKGISFAFLGAIVVGFLEEIIFRSLIMRSFYSAWGAKVAILLSSLFFAYKHFKVPNTIFQGIAEGVHTAHWYTGFQIAYYDSVGIFMTFDFLKLTSLFLFGVLLCVAYIRTRSLYSSIALHAGIVWTMLSYKKIIEVLPDNLRNFFGSSGMTDSYLSIILIFLLIIIFTFRKEKASNQLTKQD